MSNVCECETPYLFVLYSASGDEEVAAAEEGGGGGEKGEEEEAEPMESDN